MVQELTAREGDVLVVAYPPVKVPLSRPYAMVEVGGLTYSRKLVAGDNPGVEYERIYAFLKGMAEKSAREKVATWSAELSPPTPPAVPRPQPPSPSPTSTASAESSQQRPATKPQAGAPR